MNDLARDLRQAADAVRALPERRAPGADVTLVAYTAVVCTASTARVGTQQA
ncbi:hypothetical protein ACIG0C_21450 [Kitasatospora aureofaciens]|uniref:Uncharacterized protein n=1 Tax=Kitasatospora aureofaciens TaxID=1894 RepID=A0A8H9HXD1_KITAU|nr:hypothetical protein [Kitasatospora aureofaciens]GGU92144.1 hypothetical protein GCM10010502_51880 [Kitasatospora aureofaciens]